MPTPAQPSIDSIPPEYRHLFEGAPIKRAAQAIGYVPPGYRPDASPQTLNALAQILGSHQQNALAQFAGLMGPAPAGVMDKTKAQGQGLLSKAGTLEKQGADPADIWRKTGWGRGADGNWHFQIDNEAASIHIEQPASR